MSVAGIDPCDKANCSPDKYCVVNQNWSYTCVCTTCNDTKAEVCDTNGVTHLNLCMLNRLICLGKTNATKDHDGACPRNYYSSYLFNIIDVKLHLNRPFYRYGGHIELIRFKEDYRMPRGHELNSFVFSQPRPQGAFPWLFPAPPPKPGKAPWGRGWYFRALFGTFFLKVFLE